MNSFSINSDVQKYIFNDSLSLPFKVNGVAINKKAVRSIDFLLDQLNDEKVLAELLDLKKYTNDKVKKALDNLSEDDKILNYLKSNLLNSKYDKIGEGVTITRDIVFKRGRTLSVMSEAQRNVVLNVYSLMIKMDSKTEEVAVLDSVIVENNIAKKESTIHKSIEVNNIYDLKDREDIRLKINTILNSGKIDTLCEKQVGILNTVLRKDTVSDRQLKHIDSIHSTLFKSKVNNSYVLDNREDVKSKITKIINSPRFKDLDKKTRDILNTVLNKNKFSDKQLKYICDAYDTLPDIDKLRDENNRYLLSDRPDLKNIVDSLRLRNDLNDKTKDILNSVIKYGSVTDKQLKYLNIAYVSNVLESCTLN